MTKLRDPVSVNDVVTQRPWIGRRVSVRWMESRRSFWASIVLLSLIAAGAVWVFAFPPGAPIAGTPGQGGTETPAAPTSAVDLMPSPETTCPEQPAVDVPPELVTGSTYDTTWYPVGTMVAPSSPTGGPGDARQCFARTPEGVLYAVVTRLAEEAVNTGMTQALAERGVTDVRITGYQWQSFTPDSAILLLQIKMSAGIETQQVVGVYDATWTNNDWAVTADTSPAAVKAAADPVRVFTPWGAN